jgi:hypothetical protein
MKVCTGGCDPKPKPLSDYYRQPHGKDGHKNKCKECQKKHSKDKRRANLELVRQLDRLRCSTAAYKKYQVEYQRARRARLKQQKV